MSVQLISENCLPDEFINELSTAAKTLQNKVVVRSSLKTMEDINLWVKLFGKNTNTQWNVRSSRPMCKTRIVCSKKFVCHHSGFMKVSADENKRGRSKNANCQASIVVFIKIDTPYTRRTDPFMKGSVRLQGVITIDTLHSHNLETAETVRFLQPSSETKNIFFEYFNDGMTISEAKRFHESLYEFAPNKKLLLANGCENPTYATVSYWYDVWRFTNLGPRTEKGLLEKLIEKQAAYKENGTAVLFSEEPFAVAIVTPIMARAHAEGFSNEVCFVHSSRACDSEKHSITLVMAPCAAGAIPLGVIITKGQTYEAFCKGFQLLQEISSDTFHPEIFLTDNLEAEISAIKTVFPHSLTLLCIFHVLQAVWRWLWDPKHEIHKDHRQKLMKRFRTILYSRTPFDASEAFSNCISSCGYDNWKKYVKSQWNTKEKWCLAWRNDDSMGHHTNIFCEVSIRLFKDNVLCRVKAYNVVALVDVVSSVLEEFYKRKFKEFANTTSSTARHYFLGMMQKTNYLEKSDDLFIYLDESNNYIVPSETNKDVNYVVDVENGCCSCSQGVEGKFCEHQCAIYKFFEVNTEYFPPITTEDKLSIAKLALGKQTPSYEPHNTRRSSHANAKQTSDDNNDSCFDDNEQSNSKTSDDDSSFEDNDLVDTVSSTSVSSDESDTGTTSIEDILCIIKTCHETFGTSNSGLNVFSRRLEAIKTKEQWESFLHNAGNKVQDTSAVFRKPARVTKGRKRVHSERRFKKERSSNKRRRRIV